MASNLPPGVTDAMLPGNRPEDVAYEDFCVRLDGWLEAAGIECDEEQFGILASTAWEYVSARIA